MLLLPYGLVPLALVERFFQRFPSLWIATIFQLSIAIDDIVTASPQFFSHRGFAGAGHAVDQIISNTHPMFSTTWQDWSSSAWLTACFPIFDHLHDILNLAKPALARPGLKLTHYRILLPMANECRLPPIGRVMRRYRLRPDIGTRPLTRRTIRSLQHSRRAGPAPSRQRRGRRRRERGRPGQ